MRRRACFTSICLLAATLSACAVPTPAHNMFGPGDQAGDDRHN